MADEHKTKPELAALRQEKAELAQSEQRRKRAEEALRTSEERYRTLTENTHDLVAEADDTGRLIYVSPNHRIVLGYASSQLIGQNAFDFMHPDDRKEVEDAFRNMVTSRVPEMALLRFRHRDGTWRWMESTGNAFTTSGGEARTVILSRDITERKRAEESLRASEERFRALSENAYDLITETNREGRIVYASPSHCHTLGYDPEVLLGQGIFERVHPDDREQAVEAFRNLLADIDVPPPVFRYRHADGSWRWLESNARTYEAGSKETHTVISSRDVTDRIQKEEEQRRLGDQLRETQKLESLGVLAGGIAHDFSNLLVPMLGYASMALDELGPKSPARRRIERIKTAAQRAAELTHQLLAYAGKGKFVSELLDLSVVAREMAELLVAGTGKRVELHYELVSDLPRIEADPSEIRQVILNLITNAAEAIGDESGVITLRTGVREVDRGHLAGAYPGGSLPEGTYVYLEVSDTGCGMDEETKERIFDPFFTTKRTGRGLGLPVLLGIVRGHRGALAVQSQPGRGTTFRILLPRAEGVRHTVSRTPESASEWQGRGTILAVDDDDSVRELMQEVLERHGFSVLVAKDGREAVEIFRKNFHHIVTVVLDVTMPEMGGVRAFEEMRSIRPDAQILLSSGYSAEDTAKRLAEKDSAHFIQKPYESEALIKKLRQILET